MAPSPPLTTLQALSFDIYGTLIDWESGIHRTLTPLLRQLPPTHPCVVSRSATIAAFNAHEIALIHATPTIHYDDALRQAYIALAHEWHLTPHPADVQAVVDGVADWPAFPDTVAAVQALGKRYKLVALSNAAHATFGRTLAGPLQGVRFDGVYLAEDIGSYKPDPRNFEYLLAHVEKGLGVGKEALMHVAHGVSADQVPAEEFGISHAWIERGEHNWGTVKKQEGLRAWKTLGDMAASVEEAFEGAK